MPRGLFPSHRVSLAEFERLFASGRVRRVVVRGDRATVTLRGSTSIVPVDETASRSVNSFSLRLPDSHLAPENDLIDRFEAQGVAYRFEPPGQWAALLNFLPVLLLLSLPVLLLSALLFLLFWRRPPLPRRRFPSRVWRR